MRAFGRKVQKSLRTRGVTGTVAFLLTAGARRLKELAPSRRRAVELERVADERFDRLNNVDTGGLIPLSELDVTSENWVFGGRYQAVGTDVDFERILSERAVPLEEFTFLDLGSGKGRAVLLASALPFKQIVGVEFSAELTRIAQANLRRWPAHLRTCRDVSLLCMDAGDYRLPDGPIVLFMYNPFGPPVMDQVLANVRAAYDASPRRLVILYFTPKYSELWDEVEFLTRVVTRPGYCVYDTVRRAAEKPTPVAW